jgi:hypothetical protein
VKLSTSGEKSAITNNLFSPQTQKLRHNKHYCYRLANLSAEYILNLTATRDNKPRGNLTVSRASINKRRRTWIYRRVQTKQLKTYEVFLIMGRVIPLDLPPPPAPQTNQRLISHNYDISNNTGTIFRPQIIREIPGSHGDHYEDDCLLGCCPCCLVEINRCFKGIIRATHTGKYTAQHPRRQSSSTDCYTHDNGWVSITI